MTDKGLRRCIALTAICALQEIDKLKQENQELQERLKEMVFLCRTQQRKSDVDVSLR